MAAREGRALGIHWALAPVADVNSNPHNPVINIRSYAEDPEWVARLAAAFVAGARSGGLLTSVKHFPGHGDTAVDSHLQLATLAADRERLERVELKPFRAAIAAGVDSVMLGHVAVPALDPSGAPATLSPALARDLLRGSLGFAGLVVTDALEMKGVDAAWTGEAAIRAVRAGADAILLPARPEVAVQAQHRPALYDSIILLSEGDEVRLPDQIDAETILILLLIRRELERERAQGVVGTESIGSGSANQLISARPFIIEHADSNNWCLA